MRLRAIGSAQVSGLCIGGNPFSGFSHQSPERNQEMLDHHTPERIYEVLRTAEDHGINTFFGKAAHLVASTENKGHFQHVLATIGTFCIVTDDTRRDVNPGVRENILASIYDGLYRYSA